MRIEERDMPRTAEKEAQIVTEPVSRGELAVVKPEPLQDAQDFMAELRDLLETRK